jgi:hypothetical protein
LRPLAPTTSETHPLAHPAQPSIHHAYLLALRLAECVPPTNPSPKKNPRTQPQAGRNWNHANHPLPSTEIGVAFCSGGGFFFLLGLILFFDRALLAMGNILFLVGITLLLGPQRTFVFFARKQKWKGTLAFWAGVLLILMKWPLIGFGVELFGIFVLFGVSYTGMELGLGLGLGLGFWRQESCWLTRIVLLAGVLQDDRWVCV